MKDFLSRNKKVFLLLFLCMQAVSLKAHDDPSVDNNELRSFWKKGSTPEGLYYGIDVNDEHFGGGSRRWEPRWDQIKDAVSYEDKKIIEFGGNIGVCSTYLEKYRGAKSTTILDLHTRFKEFNDKLKSVFKTKTKFHILNIDKDPYEEVIGYDYDIAICMSFFWWVKDKERFLEYLSHIPVVIYEGHDTLEVEARRMKKVGFEYYRLLGYNKGVPVGLAKGHRPVILFSQTPIR